MSLARWPWQPRLCGVISIISAPHNKVVSPPNQNLPWWDRAGGVGRRSRRRGGLGVRRVSWKVWSSLRGTVGGLLRPRCLMWKRKGILFTRLESVWVAAKWLPQQSQLLREVQRNISRPFIAEKKMNTQLLWRANWTIRMYKLKP